MRKVLSLKTEQGWKQLPEAADQSILCAAWCGVSGGEVRVKEDK